MKYINSLHTWVYFYTYIFYHCLFFKPTDFWLCDACLSSGFYALPKVSLSLFCVCEEEEASLSLNNSLFSTYKTEQTCHHVCKKRNGQLTGRHTLKLSHHVTFFYRVLACRLHIASFSIPFTFQLTLTFPLSSFLSRYIWHCRFVQLYIFYFEERQERDGEIEWLNRKKLNLFHLYFLPFYVTVTMDISTYHTHTMSVVKGDT